MSNQLIKSKPDFSRFLKAVTRSGIPDRVPFFEIFSQLEPQVLDYIKEQDTSFEWICPVEDGASDEDAGFKRHISYMYALGYDYCGLIPLFEFATSLTTSDTTDRAFLNTANNMIKDRGDFDRYPWPDASGKDYSLLERAESFMPDGMKIVYYSRGPYLATLYLLGYEGICYLMYDDEKLVTDVINTAGESILEQYSRCAKFDTVGALAIGEDLAFFNGTYLPPAFLRKHVFPWYRKIVKACHENNKPIIYHSCGNNEQVMEDLIDCGFDAKHSHEDKIVPVWEFKRRWGDRIAVMGGFDMHAISTMNEAEIKERTAFILDRCKPGGGYTFGTGNSVADYVPTENFVTMIKEGFLLGQY